MRLLDRYLLRELIVPFCYCLVGFLVFWVSADLLVQMPRYREERLKARDLVDLYVALTPGLLVTILPVAFLLALLYALTNHARHHELTAIRAAGISLLRLSLPYVAVGFLLSLGVFALSEFLVPQGTDEAEEIRTRYQADQKATARKRQWVSRLGHYNPIDRRGWLVENYNIFTGEMIRLHVVWVPINSGQVDIFAEHGGWTNGVWTFTKVHRFTYPYPPREGAEPVPEELPELIVTDFRETPEQIRSELKIDRLQTFKLARKTQLSIREILNYYRLHPTGVSPRLRAVLDTKLHGQMAAPWTCLVVVAIALPFGARSGRRNVAVGVASSIFICFTYFILQLLSLALGSGGHVPPWIAAWAPNVLFGLTGLLLTWRMP